MNKVNCFDRIRNRIIGKLFSVQTDRYVMHFEVENCSISVENRCCLYLKLTNFHGKITGRSDLYDVPIKNVETMNYEIIMECVEDMMKHYGIQFPSFIIRK